MAEDSFRSDKSISHKPIFPILDDKRIASPSTSKLLFPCVSFDDESKATSFIGSSNSDWLRNESYHTVVISSKTGLSEIVPAHQKQLPCPPGNETGKPASYQCDSSEKRRHKDISSSDEEREVQRRAQNKKKKKSKHKMKRREKDPKLKKMITEECNKPNTIWIEEAQLAPEKAFRLHNKPDLENCMYNTLYRLDVALYKLKSRVVCLGIRKHQVINLHEKKGKKKKVMEVERYWKSEHLQSKESHKDFVLSDCKLKGLTQLFHMKNDSLYVPLELPQEQAKLLEQCGNGMRDEVTGEVNSHEFGILEKTGHLNQKLRKNPHDIKTWLTLVKFQEEVVGNEESLNSSLSVSGGERKKAATRAIIEKKIAVYEKALEQNPTSVELIVGHLDLCGEILDTDQLVQKWKKVSFLHPNNTLLWKHYLLFRQCRFSVFSFSRATKTYGKCLSTLSSIKEGTFASHKVIDSDLESEMLDFFIQGCQMAKQAGHTEKAVASYQAMVELNCFCSPDLEKNTPLSGQVAFLETFWDSEQARFGEEGADGWQSWMNSEKSTTTGDPFDIKKIFKADSVYAATGVDYDEEIIVKKDQPLWKNWLEIERSREQVQLKPWQPDRKAEQTEEDCDDPERLVVFDDISANLFKINKHINKLNLILSFLTFLGVPVPSVSSTTSSGVHRFLNTSLEDKVQLLGLKNPSTLQFLGLWQSYHWRDIFESQEGASHFWPSMEALSLIRNIFIQSSSVFEGEEHSFLNILWLWFEFCLSQKGVSPKDSKLKYKAVKRLAKTLLKQTQNRNDLKLWQTYAEIEWLSGNITEARKVFDTALMMCTELFSDEKERRESLTAVVSSYAGLELGLANTFQVSQHKTNVAQVEGNQRALRILTMFTEGAQFELVDSTSCQEVVGIRLLRARKTYQKWHQQVIDSLAGKDDGNSQNHCSTSFGSASVHQETCCVIFEYLTTGIREVLAMLDELMSAMSFKGAGSNEMDSELILSFYVKLLKFHSETGGALSLKDTRKALCFLVEKFPDNPNFMSFYIQREAKSNLTGEIRRMLDRAVLKATTPVPWMFAIHYEQLRSKSMVPVMECSVPSVLQSEGGISRTLTSLPPTGVIHRQHSLFERAVSNSGRHCVALWRMFMDFESKNGKEKVKSVFYQALQSCPWAKVLYMDAIIHFPDELQEIVDLMTEKEIRLRAPLEEIELVLHG